MFKRVKRYTYENSEAENIGRRLILKERKKLGDCPLYQVEIIKDNKVSTRANLTHIELIALYFTWNNADIATIYGGKKKIIKVEKGFEQHQLIKNLWKKKTEVVFTQEEEKLFLNHVKEHLHLDRE